MEKIYFVKNGQLREVNMELAKGGIVKHICAVTESIAMAGGAESDMDYSQGDIFAYIVVDCQDTTP
ncbi:MAG: hypothetical protein IKQ39_05830 [Oscillospiraceae bacterium]|nr:hypothetical protein [Oscillospiraceae bacterium]